MPAPNAFISHSSEDHQLAENLATDLRSNGVEAWYDEWEIAPGDSLRRKVDEGIEGCDYFIVLLSPDSIESEWVQIEIDGAFIERIEGKCKLIVVPHNVTHGQIPPTLRGLKYVRLDDYDKGLQQLVDACHGVSRRPHVTGVPVLHSIPGLPLSSNAARLAQMLNLHAEFGYSLEYSMTMDEIAEELSMPSEDVEHAILDLEELGFIEARRDMCVKYMVFPLNELFWMTDKAVKNWDPWEDAVSLANALMNGEEDTQSLESLSLDLGWDARRTNPPATILGETGKVYPFQCTGRKPFVYDAIMRTEETSRFVRQNG